MQNSGEGNGTPLQYSCLENPMDEGARWAAVHGVAKSRTRLTQLSSSSSSSAELKLTVILPEHFEAIAQFSCHCCSWEVSVCLYVCV